MDKTADNKLNILFAITMGADFLFLHSLISQLALVIFAVAILFICRRPHNSQWFFLSFALFTLWSYIVISSGHAVDNQVAGKMTTTLLLNTVFLYAFASYCDRVQNTGTILAAYKNTAIVCCLIVFVLGLGGSMSGNRLDSVMGQNSNVIGRLAAYASIIHIYQLRKKEVRAFKDYLPLVLFFMIILMSGSRTAFLIPLMAFFILSISSNPRHFLLYAIGGSILLYISFILVMNVGFLYDLIGYRLETIFVVLSGNETDEGSYLTRVGFFELAWEESQNSPFWGHGIDCFRTLRHAYGTYSHSNYMEILYGTGWVGIILYYSTLLLAIIKSRVALSFNRDEVALALSLLIPYIICDYQNVTYFERGSIFLPALCVWTIINSAKGSIYEA